MGSDRGSTMLNRILNSPAPSMRADSNRSLGRPSKKAFITMKLYTATRLGRISAHRVLRMPVALTIR